MAAFDRGEINAVWSCGPELAGRLFPEWIEEGRLAPMFWWEQQHSDEWMEQLGSSNADVPHIFEVGGVEGLITLQERLDEERREILGADVAENSRLRTTHWGPYSINDDCFFHFIHSLLAT